jgi:hypothetical protein
VLTYVFQGVTTTFQGVATAPVPILTDAELQAALRVSRQTLWRLRNSPAPLPFFKVGSQYRYRTEDVERWLVESRYRDPQLVLPLAEAVTPTRRRRAKRGKSHPKGKRS